MIHRDLKPDNVMVGEFGETLLLDWGLAKALGQPDEAADLLQRSVCLPPVMEDLGAMQELLGQTDKAVASSTAALKLRPDDVKIQVKRGWARADLRPPQYDKAREDFEAVLRRGPTHAEAHTALGYVLACLKSPGEARRAANLALLHGGGDYLVLHNVACVFAKMAQNDANQATEYEDLVIDSLRRAVQMWRKGGTGPDEIRLIQTEPAFHPRLRARKEFKDLITPRDL